VTPTPVAIGPTPIASYLAEVVVDSGARLVEPADAEVLVWSRHNGEGLVEFIEQCPAVRWVQLPSSGIDWLWGLGIDRPEITWTSVRGVFGGVVADLTVGLILAAFRSLHTYIRAETWLPELGRPLDGARVGIVGAGGIAAGVVERLTPFGVETTVLSRSSAAPHGATAIVGPDELPKLLATSDSVVLAVPLTDQTRGMIGAEELAAMKEDAWLVNVARGPVVDTVALVEALQTGAIGGAALDVTDPEPLPDGHPLWTMPNVILTPHVGSTAELSRRPFAGRLADNLRRWAGGELLLGVVDPASGY
jgi:phosphoglycerate dehydrogenase-like enzyme